MTTINTSLDLTLLPRCYHVSVRRVLLSTTVACIKRVSDSLQQCWTMSESASFDCDVAVIGAGPGGLAAALAVQAAGYTAQVFDKVSARGFSG